MTDRFEKPLISTMRNEVWVRLLTQIHDLDDLTFDLDFAGAQGYCESFLDSISGLTQGEADVRITETLQWINATCNGYEDYIRSKMLKKKQTLLNPWLERHVCHTSCEQIARGRAATRAGLPRSDTHGQWTLPEVDANELGETAESTGIDELDEEGYK